MRKAFHRMRDGFIAGALSKTANQYRNKPGGYGKGWNFKRLFNDYERKRDRTLPEETTGSGVKVFTSNAEIVNRLMLLISSKEAGNESTEIDNEIIDILDHLRSSGLLTSSEYEILHSDLI